MFDWALAERCPPGVRLMLAGGLHPSNVAQAIHRVRPWGVDVSSGVEPPRPGHKDARKLRAFIRAAREPTATTSTPASWAPDPDPEVGPYDWTDDGA